MKSTKTHMVVLVCMAAVALCAQKVKVKFPVEIELNCDKYFDEQKQCVGNVGDIFTFYLTLANRISARRLALELVAMEEPPNIYRIPNGYQILEMSPLKTTPFAIGEEVKVKIVVLLNSDRYQSLEVKALDQSGPTPVHCLSTFIAFNEPGAVERFKALGKNRPKANLKKNPTQK